MDGGSGKSPVGPDFWTALSDATGVVGPVSALGDDAVKVTGLAGLSAGTAGVPEVGIAGLGLADSVGVTALLSAFGDADAAKMNGLAGFFAAADGARRVGFLESSELVDKFRAAGPLFGGDAAKVNGLAGLSAAAGSVREGGLLGSSGLADRFDVVGPWSVVSDAAKVTDVVSFAAASLRDSGLAGLGLADSVGVTALLSAFGDADAAKMNGLAGFLAAADGARRVGFLESSELVDKFRTAGPLFGGDVAKVDGLAGLLAGAAVAPEVGLLGTASFAHEFGHVRKVVKGEVSTALAVEAVNMFDETMSNGEGVIKPEELRLKLEEKARFVTDNPCEFIFVALVLQALLMTYLTAPALFQFIADFCGSMSTAVLIGSKLRRK